jgi:hypothetical protein
MTGRFARGWSMARESFAVLRRYPQLAILPMISGAIFLVAIGAIVASLLPQFPSLYATTGPIWDRLGETDSAQLEVYLAAAVAFYVLAVIAIFCNVALIHCALRAHVGAEPTLREGFAAAMACLPQILGWAVVALTVGMILNVIESTLKDKLGFLGSIVGGLLEFGWSVVTYFVLPVLAAERLGPIAAIRRSSALLREKWGESLAGQARFGLVTLLFILQAALVFAIGLALSLSGKTALAFLGPVLMALGVAYAIAIMVVMQALSSIFQAGVYLYATTGQLPPAFDRELVEGAFQPKRQAFDFQMLASSPRSGTHTLCRRLVARTTNNFEETEYGSLLWQG